jgi:hypothetical protein
MSEPTEPRALAKVGKTKSEIARIAKEAGCSAVDLTGLLKTASLGELIKEIGPLDVGMGMYIFGKQKLEETIEKLSDKIRVCDNDENVAVLGETQRKLITAYREHAEGIIEARGKSTASQMQNRPIHFPPTAVVQAVVIKTEDKDDTKKATINI